MMLRMMEEVGRITGVQDQDIWIYLCNLAPDRYGLNYGHVLPKPGARSTPALGMTVCLRLSRTISRASAQPKKTSRCDCRAKERRARRTAMARETRQYLRDFNRLNTATTTARELYDGMLEIYPDRVNPGLALERSKHRQEAAKEAYSYARERRLVEGGGPIAERHRQRMFVRTS